MIGNALPVLKMPKEAIPQDALLVPLIFLSYTKPGRPASLNARKVSIFAINNSVVIANHLVRLARPHLAAYRVLLTLRNPYSMEINVWKLAH